MRFPSSKLIHHCCGAMAVCLPLAAGCSDSLGTSVGAASTSHGGTRSSMSLANTPIVASRPVLDFGIVPQGDRVRQFFELRNVSDKTVELNRIETSCECLEVRLAKGIIASGESVIAAASLDLTREPDFTGCLGIEVTCVSRDGASGILVTVDVDVRPEANFDGLSLARSAEKSAAPARVLEPTPMRR